MEHAVDAVVAGVGTGGTITGLSRFFERAAPQTDIVLADAGGSVLANYVKAERSPRRSARGWWKASARISFLPCAIFRA